MVLPALALVVALVVQDQTPLRASAHDAAPRQTTLSSGDWLEVRGERQGYLQVYDHRRERPGYVRPNAVRTYPVEEAVAPKLGTLVEFFKDAPGQESLGIGVAALFLRAAPPKAIGPEVFDAIGTMADRLARRASARIVKAGDAALAAQLEVAESYGVHFVRFEKDGQTQVCYDGEAFRHVLALGGADDARVRAALGVTDPRCLDPALGPTAAFALTRWQAGTLEGVDPSAVAADVPAHERARLRLRRASVQATLAYFAARTGDLEIAKRASEAAKHELLLADRASLADEDALSYDEAALRVAAVRWAREPAAPPSGGLTVEVAAALPGQTCLRVAKRATPPAAPFEHCTYAVVWPSSIRIAPNDGAISVVVSPLSGWSELLVIHRSSGGWVADTMTPATIDPELGYVESAGFSPDGTHLLVVREARASGPLGSPNTLAPWVERRFQVVTTTDLRVEKQATTLAGVPTFRRWQSADWQRGTVALR
jgi:hypothetical protein